MMRKLCVLALVALLAACGSSVKLDDVPVEDKAGTTVAPVAAGAGASAGGAAQSAVKPVDLHAGKPGAEFSAAMAAGNVVFFDYDSFAIRPDAQALVDAHAKALRADKNRRVNLEGHTDERGGREYNLALGQKRAEAVRRALALLGVADAQMEAVSFGKEKLADATGTESGMAKNRRVVLTYR